MHFFKKYFVPVCLLLFQFSLAGTTYAQIYNNGFEGGGIPGTTSFSGGATGDPGLGIASSTWSTDGIFTTFVGTAPTAATAMSLQPGTAPTTTWTLNVPVVTGFLANITSLDLDYRSTGTSYNFLTITINGAPVYAGPVLNDASFHHLSFTGLTITGITTSITVVSVMSGGSHGSSSTFRYDNVTLNGSVVPANHAPVFVNGPVQSLVICQNSAASLASALAVTDIDLAQTETWTVLSGPTNGSLSGFPVSAPSTGGVVLPGGLSYTPTVGYIGVDAFTIGVFDGMAYDTTVVNVTVQAMPQPILGTPDVCEGASVALSHAVGGGTWSSAPASVATVDMFTGTLYGVTAGTAVIGFTSSVTGCSSLTTATVNVAPAPIIGAMGMCAGTTMYLTDAVAGGAWSSGNMAVATVDNWGGIYGLSNGTTNISYAIGACFAVFPVTVTSIPPITGNVNICAGGFTTLSNALAGGVWSSAHTAVATITPFGDVSGIASGTSLISYTFGTCATTLLLSVGFPVAPITGPDTICGGVSVSLHNATLGGVWSSGSTTIAGVNAAGVVTGVSQGTVVISYSLGSCSEVHTMYIKPGSAGVIQGKDSLCTGPSHAIWLSSAVAGGVWSSTNTSRATVDPSLGRVTGVGTGYDTIKYRVSNSCGTFTSVKRIYIRPYKECATGLDDRPEEAAPQLSVYPNPNSGSFTVSLGVGNKEDIQVVITNVVGAKVHELIIHGGQSSEVRMNVPPGLYMLVAYSRDQRYFAKLVVN